MSENKYPIVLAHGIARFDQLRNPLIKKLEKLVADRTIVFDQTHYFRRIRSHLEDNGFETFYSDVDWAGDLTKRGPQLARNIRAILKNHEQDKVHIIGHSMGGLDARYMIAKEGMADKVASLTTIGTPHLGTTLATCGLFLGGGNLIKVLDKLFDIDAKGFSILTPAKLREFNEEVRNAEAKNDVVYHVYASSEEKERVRSFLQPFWEFIHDNEGDNDGLVPVSSQLWTNKIVADDGTTKPIHQHHFPVPADHSNQIGWWDRNELPNGRFMSLNWLREIDEYEAQIRDVYLQIAYEVTARPMPELNHFISALA